MALFPFGGGVDRQPHHTLLGVRLLQPLHVAAVVVLADKRAVRVDPLQDDELALKPGGRPVVAIQVRQREGWRRLTDHRVGPAHWSEQQEAHKNGDASISPEAQDISIFAHDDRPPSANQRSQSMAAMQPLPAAVIAWRYFLSCTSTHANTPETEVCVESGLVIR